MAAALPAGELDRRLVILKSVPGAKDGHGARVPGWDPQPAVWAKRTDVSDGERLRADNTGQTLLVRFIVRDTPSARAVTGDDRCEEGGQLFDVIGNKQAEKYARGVAREITGKAVLTDG